MANVVVIGAQWGDEGKGKIVDWLSSRADVVVRFQGGHNAGHTLVIDGKVYKLSLLPSGIVRPGKLSIIGHGVVVDPWALVKEIEMLRSQGAQISPSSLKIAANATLILPFHSDLDHFREELRGEDRIGTTGRGIGPAYEDKVARRALRFCDLMDEGETRSRVSALVKHHNIFRKGLGKDLINEKQILASLASIAPLVLPYVDTVWRVLDQAKKERKLILFEGAQGVLLDIDQGTYPYVTSSNTVAAQAATGSGVGPHTLGQVLGIVKAYTTRVGEGPFPTELHDDVGQHLGEKGREFGTVTGRRRRCGWFDAALVRQSIKISGITGVVFTKLDVLDGLKTLKVCTGYSCPKGTLDYLPYGANRQEGLTPVYEELEGWQESTYGARSWADLPAAAIKYIRRVEELIEAPVHILSTSPEREDTILVKDPFEE